MSDNACDFCEEEGSASYPLRWRPTLDGSYRFLAHADCWNDEIQAITSDAEGR